jgi:predicted dehydrogenase
MWTGPAPKLPYYPMMRRRSWRNFWEFGSGTLGDMGVHMFDMTRWFLNLRYPKRIYSTCGIYLKKGGTPNIADTQTVVFDYGDLEVVWNHRSWAELTDQRHPWGAYFYGEHGLLKASIYGYDFKRYRSNETISGDVDYEYGRFPEEEHERDLERPCAQAIRSHMKDLLDRIADRGRPRSDIEEGAISTICCILGNISMKLGRSLEWDEEAGKVKNDDEANAMLAREYRAPWVHPQV